MADGPMGKPSAYPTNPEEMEQQFTSVKEVGRGRFGEVRLVERRTDGLRLALKRTAFGSAGQPDRDKVEIEASALARLRHENVVRHYGAWPEGGHFCILMEFASYGDFATLLASRWSLADAERKKFLEEEEVMGYFVQLADGLAHIHTKKVLHRDLKPENVFVYDGGVLKIGDFGIARCLTTSVELAQTVVGSPTYISPEIIHGAAYSFKTDVWSLGVLLYRIASNKYPFDANNLAQLALKITAGSFPPLSPKYSPLLHHLVASMLQIDADARCDTPDVINSPVVAEHREKRRQAAAGFSGRDAALRDDAALMATDGKPVDSAAGSVDGVDEAAGSHAIDAIASPASATGAPPVTMRTSRIPTLGGAPVAVRRQSQSVGDGATAEEGGPTAAEDPPHRPHPYRPNPVECTSPSCSSPAFSSCSSPGGEPSSASTGGASSAELATGAAPPGRWQHKQHPKRAQARRAAGGTIGSSPLVSAPSAAAAAEPPPTPPPPTPPSHLRAPSPSKGRTATTSPPPREPPSSSAADSSAAAPPSSSKLRRPSPVPSSHRRPSGPTPRSRSSASPMSTSPPPSAGRTSPPPSSERRKGRSSSEVSPPARSAGGMAGSKPSPVGKLSPKCKTPPSSASSSARRKERAERMSADASLLTGRAHSDSTASTARWTARAKLTTRTASSTPAPSTRSTSAQRAGPGRSGTTSARASPQPTPKAATAPASPLASPHLRTGGFGMVAPPTQRKLAQRELLAQRHAQLSQLTQRELDEREMDRMLVRYLDEGNPLPTGIMGVWAQHMPTQPASYFEAAAAAAPGAGSPRDENMFDRADEASSSRSRRTSPRPPSAPPSHRTSPRHGSPRHVSPRHASPRASAQPSTGPSPRSSARTSPVNTARDSAREMARERERHDPPRAPLPADRVERLVSRETPADAERSLSDRPPSEPAAPASSSKPFSAVAVAPPTPIPEEQVAKGLFKKGFDMLAQSLGGAPF